MACPNCETFNAGAPYSAGQWANFITFYGWAGADDYETYDNILACGCNLLPPPPKRNVGFQPNLTGWLAANHGSP